MPDFCDKSKAMIQEIIQLKAKLALTEAKLLEEFSMEVDVDFTYHRHLDSDQKGEGYKTDMVLVTQGSVSVPLPTGALNPPPAPFVGSSAQDVMDTICECGHRLGEHHTLDMNCTKCDCANFHAVTE